MAARSNSPRCIVTAAAPKKRGVAESRAGLLSARRGRVRPPRKSPPATEESRPPPKGPPG